ncbi:MAG: SAM-dependent methyltransferase [Acidimicrobiales bacterium]|nr:SAM-dependent methyltransferase [Acidimicrobiales bacterium]
MDARWEALGCPPGFTVVEAAAGSGTLARAVYAASPRCLHQGCYVMVERSAALREAQPSGGNLYSVAGLSDVGPISHGVLLANELLDNLAFGVLEAANGVWCEVRVDVDPDNSDLFREVLGDPVNPPVAIQDATSGTGARIPVQTAAKVWVVDALDLLVSGSVLVMDYASTTREMAYRPQGEWLRTYRGHDRGGPPLVDPGYQDVTVEVAVDQLPDGAVIATQADFLVANGITNLVDEGLRTWEDRAHLGDLKALQARSRIAESEALLDPAGLGGFTVLEWTQP